MKRGAHGSSLPDGESADGILRSRICGGGRGPGREEFLDDGFVCTDLGNDGDDASFDCGGDAAVGRVVAKPDDVGDERIEVGEVECGDVAADAVDHEPGARLPRPADRLGWERVVDAEGAADDEGSVGDVMNFAHGPLLLQAIDEETADVEG